MKKKDINLRITGLIVFGSIIFCLTIAPFIVNFLLTLSSPFGFINESNINSWIGYFGSILGGALTLGGVWWTIIVQEKKRKEDLGIQYRPIITCNGIEFVNNVSKEVINGICIFTDSNESNHFERFRIEIENKGFGEAYINNVEIENIVPIKSEFIKLNKVDEDITNKAILPINDKITLGIEIQENFKSNTSNLLCFSLKTEFSDLFGVRDYFIEYIFQIEIIVNKNKREVRVLSYEGGTFVKRK